MRNVFIGNNEELYNNLKESIKNAKKIDIIVSFLMESGVKLILEDLKDASERGANIRILTSDYLNITQPQALYLLKEIKNIDLRFYNVDKSFHPKSYIFENDEDCEIYIGSSNLSKGGLTTSIEWNYHFKKSGNPKDFNEFYNTFEDLFNNYSSIVTDDILRNYSKMWKKPKIDFSKYSEDENSLNKELRNSHINTDNINKIEPKGAQIEALYSLNQIRNEGYDKGLVVAATGLGKTYLSAFDTKNYSKVLFVAHREEILKQAAESFNTIYPDKSIGFFYSKIKDTNTDLTFALVQTLGKDNYLNESYFKKDYFDYIIIDEFHHATAKNYNKIINYFKPKFLLGLTATPERLDNKDVFALCDYNIVYEIRLKEAINKGWLAPFRYYGIYDDTIDYSTITIRNGIYDEKNLEEKLMINKRADLVLKHYLKYSPKRTIGFCASRNHAEFMAKYFNEQNIASAAVYSGEQREFSLNRTEAIDKLKKGELNVLFTVDMFNEGIDIPSIDTVLFLRPTQSPTIFLQQLGRGLRKYKNKEYLTVLDFIGNYKKANLVPLLLSGELYDTKIFRNSSPLELDYPEDCYIDFDFELIDLFKEQAKNELKIKDKIYEEYLTIKSKINNRPTRVDLFLGMDETLIDSMKKRSKFNLFKDYLKFLSENDELAIEEEKYKNTIAHEFLKTIENTHMTKSYKMPILNAFYNDGNIKMNISEDDVYKSMKEFYEKKSNSVDMLKNNTSRNYENWTKKEYLKLAYKNPIKYLKKTHGEFFIEKENYSLGLNEELKEYIHLESFKEHFKDIIEYRTLEYYKNRFEKNNKY